LQRSPGEAQTRGCTRGARECRRRGFWVKPLSAVSTDLQAVSPLRSTGNDPGSCLTSRKSLVRVQYRPSEKCLQTGGFLIRPNSRSPRGNMQGKCKCFGADFRRASGIRAEPARPSTNQRLADCDDAHCFASRRSPVRSRLAPSPKSLRTASFLALLSARLRRGNKQEQITLPTQLFAGAGSRQPQGRCWYERPPRLAVAVVPGVPSGARKAVPPLAT
jgi:hypothetical protein